MKLWSRLYNAVWLAFFCCVLMPRSLGPKPGAVAHILLGLAMLGLAGANAMALAALPVPARLKRVSQVAAKLSGFQLVIGLALGAVTHMLPDQKIVASVLYWAHVVAAFAILAQSASVATGYDMWEEKEFEVKPEAK